MYPFEKFTERAKKVLTLAQEEAEKAHHHYIGTEHLLLGLLREREGVAAKVLDNFRVEIGQVRESIESVLGRSERILIQQIIPTSRVKKVIEISFQEASRMGHESVGTEHLLLGLLVEGEGIAAHVLQGHGVTEEKARAEIERVLQSGEAPPRAPRPGADPPVLSLQLGGLLQGARQEAVRQGHGVITLHHLLKALVDDAGYQELIELLDRRRVPWNPPDELKELSSRIHELVVQKTEAASRQQYEAAANLRAEEIRLRNEYTRAEQAWIASWKGRE